MSGMSARVNSFRQFDVSELVYGHDVNGPLKIMKEQWLGTEEPPNVVKYVSDL